MFPLVFYALWQCVLVADSKETRRNKHSNKENNRERERERRTKKEGQREGRVKQTSSAKLVYECWLLGQRPHDKAANWNWGLVLVVAAVPSKGYPMLGLAKWPRRSSAHSLKTSGLKMAN